MGTGSDSVNFTHASVVSGACRNPEKLEETFVPINDLKDELIDLFMKIYKS
jgi:hypothetical protein